MRELHRWQHQFLGTTILPTYLSTMELATFFTFSDAELADIHTRYKANLKLAAAMQLGFLKMSGRPLSGLRVIPRDLLKHIGLQLQVAPPTIASLKAIYRRRPRTLYSHQSWAIEAAKMARPSEAQFARLLPYLRHESRHNLSTDELVAAGKVWLYQHGFIIPADRAIRDYAREAMAAAEQGLLETIQTTIPETTRKSWEKHLLQKRDKSAKTYLEWLAEPPRKGNRAALSERTARISFLNELKVNKFQLADVPLTKLKFYSEEMHQMRPAKFRELQDPLRTLRLVCFLKWSLMQLTDTAVLMASRQITKLWRDAYDKATVLEAKIKTDEARPQQNGSFTYGPIGDISTHSIRAGLTANFGERWESTLRGRYVGRLQTVPTNPVTTLPGSTVIDFNLNRWLRKDINLGLDIYNVFDHGYAEPGIRTADAGTTPGLYDGNGVWHGSAGAFSSLLPQEGRTLMLTLTFKY